MWSSSRSASLSPGGSGRAAPLQQEIQALSGFQGNRGCRGRAGDGEPLAGAQDQFGSRSGAGEHRATVVRRVHGVALPPEVKRRAAGDRENDGPANRPHPADQQRTGMSQWAAGAARHHEVNHLAHRVGAQKPGHEHIGIGHVQLPGPDRLSPDLEAAAAVRVQQGREHRWRVEPRQAAPVDRPVHSHQRHRVQVADDRVILDGRVTVRHDASPAARLSRRADAVCERGV